MEIMTKNSDHIKRLGVLLFPNFELLDVCGPLEVFGKLPDKFEIILISEKRGLVKSAQDVSIEATHGFYSTPALDLVLIPGGMGTRVEVNNQTLLHWIQKITKKTGIILSVCTGAALLAKAGVLDNRRATSNKIAFQWVVEQGPHVTWIKKARWVDDDNVITSSGIAAGIDMSLYVIQKLYSHGIAKIVAHKMEYIWNEDESNDVFSDCL